MQLPRQVGNFRLVSAVIISLVVVASVLISFMNAQIAGDDSRRLLKERAETIATALDTQHLASLTGSLADTGKDDYAKLKARLASLKQINTDARSIYIAGKRGEEVFVYVDSEQAGSRHYVTPGSTYNLATNDFRKTFSSPASRVVGPLRDSYGSWVTGLAPVINFDTGGAVAVIGIDVDAALYNQAVALAALIPLGVGIIFIMIILFYDWARRREEDLLRMRSELVSIASHELRSPIAGIRWATEGLLKKTTGVTAPSVQAIYDSVIQLQSGIEDILQLVRVTNQSASKLKLAPADMAAILHEVCQTQALVAEQKNVKLIMDDSWPKKLIINCDGAHMKRAIHNIMSNAIKYTRDGTDVTVHYEHTKGMHSISIADHGIGIPKDEQARVFSGFYRATNAQATGIAGTGLGLYLTRTILEEHHGEVSFTSEEGSGTTFVLSLPTDRNKEKP